MCKFNHDGQKAEAQRSAYSIFCLSPTVVKHVIVPPSSDLLSCSVFRSSTGWDHHHSLLM